MADKQTRAILQPIAQTLVGSLVVFLTVPTGIGPIGGGWLASRRIRSRHRRVVASAGAGVLGVLPWTVVTFFAMSGAIEPTGYHIGIAHVGVLTASPGSFVLWQEVGVSGVLTVTVAAFAIAGGLVTGLLDGEARSHRRKASQ